MAVVQEYFRLTDQYKREYGPTTILLMQVGSFMEVYAYYDKATRTYSGSSIVEFTQICDLNIAEKVTGVVMAGFKDIMVEKYIKKLQEADYTAVVYMQDPAPNASGSYHRSLAGIFSPGTYFPTEDTKKLTNHVLCVWTTESENMSNKLLSSAPSLFVGLAAVDIMTGSARLFQTSSYDDAERFISIVQPSEVIWIREQGPTKHRLTFPCKLVHEVDMTSTSTTPFSMRARSCEKQTYQREVLLRFYERTDMMSELYSPFVEHVYATQAFCFLLDFLYQHNPYLVKRIAEPRFETESNRLLLANHSLKQLNILDDNRDTMSIARLLNFCVTPMGKRQFVDSLVHPVTDVAWLNKEYDKIQEVLGFGSNAIHAMRIHLSQIRDLSQWNRRIFLRKVAPASFVAFHQNMVIIGETISESVDIKQDCIHLRTWIEDHLNLEAIDSENCIRTGVDADLDKLVQDRKNSESKLDSIRRQYNEVIAMAEKKSKSIGLNTEYLRFHETERGICSLVGTRRRCELLKKSVKDGSIELVVIGANCAVRSAEIDACCHDISDVKARIRERSSVLYQRFVEGFESRQTEIGRIIDYVVAKDMVYAKAEMARRFHFCRPAIITSKFAVNGSFLAVKGLRHPLIEQIQVQEEIYVANDLSLEEVPGVLLYGTNAVGKTSFIKAVGVAIILAQAGFYVPATSFHFSPFHSLYTRILGNDNIYKGLSTFAVEMSELRTILQGADDRSLILGDELCSGTESVSAISIFVAGVQHLCNKKSSFVFATHMHEIVGFAEIEEEITKGRLCLKHMAVIYDREKDALVFDRKLKEGPGDSMYGLEVCKSLHLPGDFLLAANEIRMRHFPEVAKGSILSLRTSRYNSQKVVGACEQCGKPGVEVHHLLHQKDADLETQNIVLDNGSVVKKNHLSNLMTLCSACHDGFHTTGSEGEMHIKVKTSTSSNMAQIKGIARKKKE